MSGEECDQHEQGDKTARPPQEEREQRTRDGAREGHAAAQAELVRKRSEQGRSERAREAGRRVQQAELKPAHAYGMIKDVQEREHGAHGEKMQKIKRGHPPEGDCAGGLRAHRRATKHWKAMTRNKRLKWAEARLRHDRSKRSGQPILSYIFSIT